MPRFTVLELKKQVSAELRKGRIVEAPIEGDDLVEGLCNWETKQITVNPSVSVVDTLIHELLHRRFPDWTEERVRMETWRIMRTLGPKDVANWYRRYKRRARLSKTVVRLRSAELRKSA